MTSPSIPPDLSKLRINRDAPSPPLRRALKRNLALLLGAVIVFGGAFLILGRGRAVPVQTAVATAMSGAGESGGGAGTSVTANGYVVARTRASVAAKLAGRIAELFYRVPDSETLRAIIEEDPYHRAGAWTGYVPRSFETFVDPWEPEPPVVLDGSRPALVVEGPTADRDMAQLALVELRGAGRVAFGGWGVSRRVSPSTPPSSWVKFDGQTPFLRAALSGDVTLMRYLLEKGADPNLADNDGERALDWATHRADQAKIEAAARHATVVKAGNMSLGVNLLALLTRRVAEALGPEFDIEILDMHHRHKRDAPSGTSLMLGAAAAKGRQVSLAEHRVRTRDGDVGPRREGDIGFAALRGGDVVGEHRVIFAGPGERIELAHIATDRGIFARGAVAGALWARGREPGLYSMADVLSL
jgi:hypothetical protein